MTALLSALALIPAASASAADQIYFAATDNITDVLVQKINAEPISGRIDMSCWYLTEHSISIALLSAFNRGVPVRLIGDRGAIFEIDRFTRQEFYWLASQGVPIRLRYNPTWYPEIDHWKTTIFAGQNLVAFGSANYTPFELAPASSTNYKDELVLLSSDPSLVGAFKTKFDKYWNDTTTEPESKIYDPPFFKNWNDACATESVCSDYHTQYPSPVPMVVNTARLEADYPLPPEMNWGQGPVFNNRLTQAINAETSAIDFVIYRLTVDNITDALLAKHAAGVPIRIIVEPNEYLNRKWPEFWITHANVDKLWAAGIPMKKRIHDGLTHMKSLITSDVVTIASSNYAAAWQRDQNYFLPALQKPVIYQAIKNRFQTMWNDSVGFAPFVPQPPDAPDQVGPAFGATGVSTTPTLAWHKAPFAASFDVYLGTAPSTMTVVAIVPAVLANDPPDPYGWTPASPLQSGTTYYWKVVSRTNASLIEPSAIWSFSTAGPVGPPAAPSNPSPSDAATAVGTSPTLGWSPGAMGTTYNVSFGTANPPPQVASGLTSASFSAGSLSPATTYFWRVAAVSSGGTTPGPVWSFTTGNGGGGTPAEIVIYASDATRIAGAWTTASDASAAGLIKLTNLDQGAATLDAPLASPTNYFEATFAAQAGTRYRVWLRIHAIGDSKWNDSVFAEFSDSVTSAGTPIYRIGTAGGYIINLWTCATCQSVGWGWQRNAYWLGDSGDVWFQNTGQHTIRVQTREDGAEIDQIVISPTTYATNAPGPVSNDTTIVPKPSGPSVPGVPGSPSPVDGAIGVSTAATLSWSATGATSYDVFFGSANPLPQVLTGTTSTSYSPSNLAASTTYYWKIVARNNGGSTAGPVWSFRTAEMPPAMPNSPNPANGAAGISTTTTLSWSAAGASSYDVLLATSDPPSQVASGLTSPSYSPSGLVANITYVWQIVAHNSGGDVQGPTWTFTTAVPPPLPPGVPGSPNPADGAPAVSTGASLSWSATGATSYDVLFGASNPPSPVLTGTTSTSYSPSNLVANSTYYWKIVARNNNGSTPGPVWSFHTVVPPATPNSPTPVDTATGVSTTTTLSWSAAGASTFDVLLGTSEPLSPVSSGLTSPTYSPAGLAANTPYLWRIIAHNSGGNVPGPTCSFRTAVAPPPPINEIVVYASDIAPATLHGNWTLASDATSPNQVKLVTPDNGEANTLAPLAAPAQYFDLSFNADAGKTYTIWFRIKALNNNKYNDAIWAQFANATVNGSTVYPIGSTSGLMVNLATDASAVSLNGWGWGNSAYWLGQATTVVFPTGGPQTLRVQIREDGVQLDQIVLSHVNYLNGAPGPPTNDSTIVPKP